MTASEIEGLDINIYSAKELTGNRVETIASRCIHISQDPKLSTYTHLNNLVNTTFR